MGRACAYSAHEASRGLGNLTAPGHGTFFVLEESRGVMIPGEYMRSCWTRGIIDRVLPGAKLAADAVSGRSETSKSFHY